MSNRKFKKKINKISSKKVKTIFLVHIIIKLNFREKEIGFAKKK